MIRKIFVECRRGPTLIKTYEFGSPATLAAPPAAPDVEHLVSEAKSMLANDLLARPPFDGIDFRVRT